MLFEGGDPTSDRFSLTAATMNTLCAQHGLWAARMASGLAVRASRTVGSDLPGEFAAIRNDEKPEVPV